MSRQIRVVSAILLAATSSGAAADSHRPPRKPQPAVEIVRVAQADAFHWSDAAIGVAGGVGITLAGLGVVLLSRHRDTSIGRSR